MNEVGTVPYFVLTFFCLRAKLEISHCMMLNIIRTLFLKKLLSVNFPHHSSGGVFVRNPFAL